ncbi:MAG TPA: nuclear transport factor 2 family protein [Reyranella sp.]|nr:nuclear transport factor 2 family protein [Reyranella sp.]
MSSDVAAIEKVLHTYFDGLYEGDTKKLGEAFHPASHLYAAGPDGKAIDWPREKWFEYVSGRPSAKSQGSARADRIVSIDFSGPNTAFAKVECQLPPRYFTDYLTLLKADGRWQVISKSYHTVMKDK